MSTKIKSMLKFQWVSILPTFLTTSSLLTLLSVSDLYQLYLPMSLGIITGGVVDFDNKFSGKVWNALTVFSFFLIAELLVFYTYHNFPLLAVTTVVSCFLFIMLGAWSKTLKTIGFGAALIVCYSMFLVMMTHTRVEAVSSLMWMLFASVYYTVVSLIVHLVFPNRGIKNNISDLYNSLSDFLLVKARFFDPDDDTFEQKLTIRKGASLSSASDVENKEGNKDKLHHGSSYLSSEGFADGFNTTIDDKLYNHTYERSRTALIQQFEVSKESLLIRLKAFSNRKRTADMLRFYLTADTIFKTIDFNVQDYKALKDQLQDTDIMFRVERIFALFAQSAEHFAYDLKTNRALALDKKIILSIERLEKSINKQHSLQNYHLDSLHLLLTKLKKVYYLFKNINSMDREADSKHLFQESLNKKLALRTRIQRFISEFSVQSATFRHACRVSLFLSIAMVIFSFVDLQFSFWFMMAGVLVIQPNYSMTKKRVKMRVYGSILGALVGATLNFDVQHWPVTLGCLTAITVTLFQFTRILNYGYSTFFLTIAVFCTFRIAGLHVDIYTVIQRIIANTAGCIVTWGLIQVIFPEWNFINLGKNVRNIYESNKKLLLTILGLLEGHPIKNFDLNKRQIIAKNAHISLQSVVANVVAEPKIYRLYISPSVRLMALNDYILSNIALINQLVIEHNDSNSLAEIDKSTVSLLEKLAIIYTKLYSYNDQELRKTIEDLVIVINSISSSLGANDYRGETNVFNLNHYLRERIIGISVALINYRHELAQIYQISKTDQSILERTHRKFAGIEILGGALAARANLAADSHPEAEAKEQAQQKLEQQEQEQQEQEQQEQANSNAKAITSTDDSSSESNKQSSSASSATTVVQEVAQDKGLDGHHQAGHRLEEDLETSSSKAPQASTGENLKTPCLEATKAKASKLQGDIEESRLQATADLTEPSITNLSNEYELAEQALEEGKVELEALEDTNLALSSQSKLALNQEASNLCAQEDSEEHYRATEEAIKDQAKHSILDIAAGVNTQSLEQIVEHRLDPESSLVVDKDTDKNDAKLEQAELITSTLKVDSKEESLATSDSDLDAQVNSTAEGAAIDTLTQEAIAKAELSTKELLQAVLEDSEDEDDMSTFLSQQEVELRNQIALEVVQHNTDEELERLAQLEEQQRLEAEQAQLAAQKTNPKLEIVGYQTWAEEDNKSVEQDKKSSV